jgi:NADPH-dependent glutamate synthase beta subunit-like oxidoreductase
MKDRVVVIGGGNVAIDAALTARRLGAKDVQIACLESGEEMPAFPDGIELALEEGVLIHNSWGPRRILGHDRGVAEIELARCKSVFDAAGAFSPSLDENDTKRIKADVIILSIGQAPDLSFVPDNMKTAEGETIQVDPVTLETNLPGIFAGGEVATNMSAPSVVEAVAAGKRASVSIDRYLRGEDLKTGRHLAPSQVKKPPKEGIARMPRQKAPLCPVNLRSGNFGEVAIGYDEDMANREVQRCMTCGSRAIIQYVADCQLCLYCERDCPEKAIFVSPERKISPLLAWG